MSADLFERDVRLAGIMDRVRFENDEGTFAVATITSPRGEVTVVGNLRGASPGERLHLKGRWEQDPKFGRQFRVSDAVVLPPTTRQGIVRYLASGLIEGIGPVLAERLVAAFGDKTLEIIEGQRHRLLDVPGIGAVRQERILAAWDRQRAVRQVMLFLSAHGVSTTYAHRIYETYGDEAVDKVRENPFRLARDIFGIGFKSADRIARELGIEADAPARLHAGVAWTLDQAGSGGHVYLPRSGLEDEAAETLEVTRTAVRTALDSLLADGTLVAEDFGAGEPAVYTRRSHGVESELAERIAHLCRLRAPAARVEQLRRLSRRAEGRLGLTLDPGQREAVDRLLGQPLGLLTGGPGTGKTTVVRIFTQAVQAAGGRVLLAAPTGRAAQRLTESTGQAAETLHRLLQFSFAERRFTRDAERPLEAELVVVDEASMLDQSLARALFRAVPESACVLLVGDADQLPSVGPGNVLKDLLGVADIVSARLTEVFRQAADSGIVRNAHRVRVGQMPEPRRGDQLADFYHIAVDTPEAARDVVLQLVTERMPKAFGLDPHHDIQVLAPMHRGDCGISVLNQTLQEQLNPQGHAIVGSGRGLRVGDRVIQLRNNYKREVFNGQIGRLVSLDEDSGLLRVDFDGQRAEYARTDLDELTLAYCISIHKSQGSEYPAVVVPLVTQHYMMLQRNLLYTAVTRAKRLVCLVGQPKALRRAVRNAAPQMRYTGLVPRLRRVVPR